MKLPELEELYRRYRMDLYRYLCFLTHDPVQAEDLLSETFVRVIKRLPTFRGECEVKTWLFGIARNIWLESLRRRHQSVSLDDLMERYITDDALTETTAARQKLRRGNEQDGYYVHSFHLVDEVQGFGAALCFEPLCKGIEYSTQTVKAYGVQFYRFRYLLLFDYIPPSWRCQPEAVGEGFVVTV